MLVRQVQLPGKEDKSVVKQAKQQLYDHEMVTFVSKNKSSGSISGIFKNRVYQLLFLVTILNNIKGHSEIGERGCYL